MYHGQWNTDKVIEEYFPGKRNGLCMEVGASHGTVSSNTYYFETELEWACFCIEPNYGLYQACKNNRKHAYNFAATSPDKAKNGKMEFFVVTLPNGDTTAISGLELDAKLLDTHEIASVHNEVVNVRTLDDLLDEICDEDGIDGFEFDFVSIDTEGTEIDVLEGFDLDKWRPKLLVVENNHDDPKLRKYMKKRGYKLDKRYVINDFYIMEE